MSDYDRIAAAIDFITNNVVSQPSLEQIADHVHLSPFHFQRLFCRWAGVTPKRYLQVLTLQHAKELLAQDTMPLLAVSGEIGLSSGSRLYDHFVQLEAVTPSEYKHAGRGLAISYGIHETSFGKTFLATTARGICKLAFCDGDDDFETLAGELKRDWPRAEITEDDSQTSKIVPQLFAGAGLHTENATDEIELEKPLSVFVRGTNFQIAVWRALLSIPPGTLTSYGQIARIVGKPKSSRAVGTAVGANPVSLVIPCHRVIQQSGRIGGYRWGLTRKHAMHAMETARREAAE